MSGETDSRFESIWTSFSQHVLRFTARHLKVSVRELADEVLTRETGRSRQPPSLSGRIGPSKLDSILARLPAYHAEDLEADVAEFAHAEVTEEDPLNTSRINPEDISRERPNLSGRIDPARLDSILARLSAYRAEDLEADVAEFAHAEVTEEDPLNARRIDPEDGVGAAFGHRLER